MELLDMKYKKFVDIEVAAQILGVSTKTARRYVDKYELRSNGYKMINEGDLNDLKDNLRVCKDNDLGKLVKNLFILEKEGLTIDELVSACRYMGKERMGRALNAIKFYADYYRTPFFDRFGLNPENLFLPSEVLARLYIWDFHIIKILAGEDSIALEVVNTRGRTWNYIYKESFFKYLDFKGVKARIIFTSREISRLTGIPVNRIDKIALSKEIGVKLRGTHKNSIYLFTIEDLRSIREQDRKA